MKLRLATLLVIPLAACAVDPTAEELPAPTGAALPSVQPPAPPPDAAPPPPPPDAAPPPRPDAAPPGPVMVPGVGLRYEPPAGTECGDRDQTPLLPDEHPAAKALIALGEVSSGLPKIDRETDTQEYGLELAFVPILTLADSDGDCLPDLAEAAAGTDPAKADTDGDGWFDGPCNERRKLVLTRITAHDEQEDIGDDEFYLVADDARYPNMDSEWDLDDGQTVTPNTVIASRTRGVAAARLALVHLEGMEDDPDILGNWWPDDLLFEANIDVAAETPGVLFTRRFIADGDYDYELEFRVDVEKFADPDPKSDNDTDGDGITDGNEARVAKDLGGITDPQRKDVLVEVDYMRGHAMRDEARRMVTSRLRDNGLHLVIQRDEELALDNCLSVPEARALYNDHFNRKGYGAFRYAVLGEQIWNDRSGVAWGDIFLVDDSTWWINNWILPQGGTFIHELGHTLGLVSEIYDRIDTVAWFSYDSCMNYLYQATKIDYSHDGEGGDTGDHDDWAVINPAYALKWSFALTKSNETGICN